MYSWHHYKSLVGFLCISHRPYLFYFKIHHMCKRISIMYMYILRDNSKIHICVPEQLKRKIYNNTFWDPLSSLLCHHLAYPIPNVLAIPLLLLPICLLVLKKLCKLLINSLWPIFLTCSICHFFFRLSHSPQLGDSHRFWKMFCSPQWSIFFPLLSFGRLPLPSSRCPQLILQCL